MFISLMPPALYRKVEFRLFLAVYFESVAVFAQYFELALVVSFKRVFYTRRFRVEIQLILPFWPKITLYLFFGEPRGILPKFFNNFERFRAQKSFDLSILALSFEIAAITYFIEYFVKNFLIIFFFIHLTFHRVIKLLFSTFLFFTFITVFKIIPQSFSSGLILLRNLVVPILFKNGFLHKFFVFFSIIFWARLGIPPYFDVFLFFHFLLLFNLCDLVSNPFIFVLEFLEVFQRCCWFPSLRVIVSLICILRFWMGSLSKYTFSFDRISFFFFYFILGCFSSFIISRSNSVANADPGSLANWLSYFMRYLLLDFGVFLIHNVK